MAELMAAEPRLSATVLQNVGPKGYDGFVLAVVRWSAMVAAFRPQRLPECGRLETSGFQYFFGPGTGHRLAAWSANPASAQRRGLQLYGAIGPA